MPIRFVCLANSFKLHGRCVAGIVLDENNKPILRGGKPNWIRPVSRFTEHGQIPTELVEDFPLLEVLEIDGVVPAAEGYQSENVTFDENSIQPIDPFPKEGLAALCDSDRPMIFGNKGRAVAHEAISLLDHSLMLIRIDDFMINETHSDNHPGKLQYRLEFEFKEHFYDLPITDPDFLAEYEINCDCLCEVRDIYITLSLGLNHNDFHSKLVAGLIY